MANCPIKKVSRKKKPIRIVLVLKIKQCLSTTQVDQGIGFMGIEIDNIVQ